MQPSPPSAGRCRSCGASLAGGCGSSASRTFTFAWTTPRSAVPASSSCCTSSRKAADVEPETCRPASRCRPRSRGCPTRATSRTSRRPPRSRPSRRRRRRGETAQRKHVVTDASPMSVDLGPYLEVVPTAVVERLRGARRVLAVGHENPDADTLGATLAVDRDRGGVRRSGRPGLHRPGSGAVRLPGGHRAVPHGSGPRRRLRPARDLGLRHARSGGRCPGTARRALRTAAAGRPRPPRVER